MGNTRILVVDDEIIIRESLAGWLERDGHTVRTAASGEEALALMKETRFNLLLLDIKLEGMSGLEVLKKVRESDPDTAVVMITAYGSISTAIEAIKNGACDYLLKPFDPGGLGVLIDKIVESQAREMENIYLRAEQKDRSRFESMLGQSRAMRSIFDLIRDIAPTLSTVLITGSTGTGKELAAKAIHTHSPRCRGPFLVVNCGALPEHLMESELFGHQKGAFTDAKETKRGRLELAAGGTLFLDEIGDIGMRMQIDLLRVLEDKIVYRVGGTQPIETDFRVVAATHRDLKEAVRAGRFREDLFYRLNVISFRMPSLSERKEDIPLLAEHFLLRFAQEMNKPVDRFSREALDLMMLYDWPGNVRELQNAVERAVVVCKGRTLLPEDLPILSALEAESPVSLKWMEREHIRRALMNSRWNISRCSKALGIDRSTLYSKIRRYGIQKDQG